MVFSTVIKYQVDLLQIHQLPLLLEECPDVPNNRNEIILKVEMKRQGDEARIGLEKHQKGALLEAWAPRLEA
ncbi:hypothetical protein LR48_Vigan07g165900 [Vigna angularis]|uniref:Uncharacterized protein n=1 Tax=Phaseolus angularis TaxID=3914 RepID=A0A0L9UYP8_PHAAN|nr:hypothetical protein LR48_Vigan07g165900 [Vigna angularis]